MTAMTNTAKLLEVIVYKWSLIAVGKRERDPAWCGRDGRPETGALHSHLIYALRLHMQLDMKLLIKLHVLDRPWRDCSCG
jgi:hypothetical protein